MSVLEHEPKFYVFIQFKSVLLKEDSRRIRDHLSTYGNHSFLEMSSMSIDDFNDFDEAKEFNDNFRNKYSNLIK